MRLVDKYELAKCSYGTPFYELNHCGDGYFELKDGLNILTSTTFYDLERKPLFNGVCPLLPDIYDEDDLCSIFTKELADSTKFELYEVDTDSNDFSDTDRFIVLDKKEFKILLDELQNYYNMMKADK